MSKITIWMKVTDDKYELPVAVADTAEELARIVGLGAVTLFVGNDEVGRVDEILCRAHQPHQREDAEGNH